MGPSSGPSSPPAGNALGIHNTYGAHPHLHRSLSSTAGHESPSNKYSGSLNHLAVHGTTNIPRSKHAFETDLDLGVLIDDCPMGEAFSDIPVDDDEIKKLKKKVRPYYENMSRIREQYVEVDQLLSSALPSSIVTSFQPTNSGFDRMGDTDLETGRSYGTAQSAGSKREKRNSPGSVRENANGHLDAREEDPLLASSQAKEEKREKQNRLALNVNFAVNIALLLGKGLAVLSSSSVSLVASFVDSFLDFVSTLIIFLSSVAMGKKGDRHKYPAGKKRFEPLGVLVFSVTMIASFVQVFIESFQRALATREGEGEVAELSWLGIGTMIATIVIKGIIWVWCAHMPSTAIRALAQDAENDVFFNIMSLGFPWLGGLLHWKLLDPIGGMILSGYIIWQWCQTLHENFTNLSGRAAEGHEVTRILYLVSRFKPVLQISYCEIYHLGDEIVAEIDVVLPQKSSLHYAHDVTETLQGLIESLEGVARAYVHADYSSENPAQHQVAETRHDVRRKSIVSAMSSEVE